jgi:hypothetical protein
MPSPGPLRVQFRARESLSDDTRRRLDRQAVTLARERLWWCGAPAVTIDSERQGQGYRLRLGGAMDLSFGWPDPVAPRAGLSPSACSRC